MFDYDLLGANDFMGRAEVPLRPASDKRRHTAWHPLHGDSGEGAEEEDAGDDEDEEEDETAKAARLRIP